MKSQYTKNGLYNGYKKNHKEREKLDFYATPDEEVLNILEELKLDFSNKTILEPCCGMGHMLLGIIKYINKNNFTNVTIIATDYIERKLIDLPLTKKINLIIDWNLDFLEDYLYTKNIDYIIMNPPYTTIGSFIERALEITPNLIVLGRTQFIEGENRYETILKNKPFSYMYQYVDRIRCFKDGDFSISGTSAQAYSWFIWNKNKLNNFKPELYWIRRYNKK